MATRKRTLPITAGNIHHETHSAVAERALALLKFFDKEPIVVGVHVNPAGRVTIEALDKCEAKTFVVSVNKNSDPDMLAEELRYAVAEMQRGEI